MNFSSLLFSFTGRLNRAPYWLAGLGCVAAFVVVMIALSIAGRSAVTMIVAGLAGLLLTWVALALTTKRLHDRDKSAWWALVFYVAPWIDKIDLNAIGYRIGSTRFMLYLIGFGISTWALVELGFWRGTAGPNSYGPDPLQVRRS